MHQLTTITRTARGPLPERFALLAAPVIGDETSPETEPLGVVEGVIVDESGKVAFFVVRAAQHLNWTPKRILMPLAAVSIEESTRPNPRLILRTGWTRDQLLAQPDFLDDQRLPTSRVDGTLPPEGKWAPAVPNVIPPGKGVNAAKATRAGALWGAIGALMGAAIGAGVGYAAGSLFAIIATALFFGVGAGIAGAIAGATRDSAVDAGELHAMNPLSGGPSATILSNAGTAGLPFVRSLERALRERAYFERGVLKATRIVASAQEADRMDGSHGPSIIEASKPLRT